jgi:hypothetical protein
MLTHVARWGAAPAACALAAALAAISVFGVLGGCGAPCSSTAPGCQRSTGAQGPTGAREELICIKDAQTGSHIVEARCYKRSDLDERRESDRAILEKAQMGGNRPVGNKRDQ